LLTPTSWENAFVPYASYPRYFEEYGRKEPQTMNYVPTTYAYGHPEWSFYEMVQNDPPRMQRFLRAMGPIEAKMPIAGIYDFSWVVEKAKEDPSSERLLFVDVGAGRGQAVKAIHKEFPELPLNRCMIQDRPEVIDAVKALDDPDSREVQKLVIDFHKEQPVKGKRSASRKRFAHGRSVANPIIGALLYWIRRCLHNYPDSVCINILQKIVDVMADDSKILLQEDVMDNPPSHMATMLDLMMMGFGGKQRTIENWKKVVDAAGLEISGISTGKGPWRTLSVLECVKKAS
jgi:hypothetical protein